MKRANLARQCLCVLTLTGLPAALCLLATLCGGVVQAQVQREQDRQKPPGAQTPPPPPPAQTPESGRTTSIFGIGIGLDLRPATPSRPDPVKELEKKGPHFPDRYLMNSFSVQGFVKGGWPLVIDYELQTPGIVLLIVEADGADPFFYRLDSTPGRKLLGGSRNNPTIRLPATFGDRPRVGRYSIRAFSDNTGPMQPIYLRFFGLGAGPRAIGSVAIDQLRFQPGTIVHGGSGQPREASYSFRARSDFDKARAEFYRVGKTCPPGGAPGAANAPCSIFSEKVRDGKEWGGINREETRGDKWDGKPDGRINRVSMQHQFCVRAWMKSAKEGDWVISCSGELVEVRY
ncbi:MAG: hypothetical protein ACKV2V_12165 [Blastocatellia bacterium]